MKWHLLQTSLLAVLAIIVNLVLAYAPDASSFMKTTPRTTVADIAPTQAQLDELLALSPEEAQALEKDIALERAARGELTVSRLPAQAAN